MRRPPIPPAGVVRVAILVVLVAGLSADQLGSAGAAWAAAKDCSRSTIPGLVPLNDLGAGTYQGEPGGLFPNGSNVVPGSHLETGLHLAEMIAPLDGSGRPADDGSIVLMSVGVSNTMMHFSEFRNLAAATPGINPRVVLVNGAVSGNPLDAWLDESGYPWQERVPEQLERSGVTPQQVQVVWVFVPDRERDHPPFPTWAEEYADRVQDLMRTLLRRLPNLKLAYLSSSEYRGYTSGYWAEEPIAYEEGFGIKWAIEAQIEGDPELESDPGDGPIQAPWLTWGPYLWANGTTPRGDGMVWVCQDFRDDGVHPIGPGRRKVAEMLLAHFTTDPTAALWFTADASVPTDSPADSVPPATAASSEAGPRAAETDSTPRDSRGAIGLAAVIGLLAGGLGAWVVSLLVAARESDFAEAPQSQGDEPV